MFGVVISGRMDCYVTQLSGGNHELNNVATGSFSDKPWNKHCEVGSEKRDIYQ